MVRSGLTAFAAVLILFTAGCGTVDNFLPPKPNALVYGGVRADVAALCASADSKGEVVWEPAASAPPPYRQLCLLADLPFSAVADTVTLPVLLYFHLTTAGP